MHELVINLAHHSMLRPYRLEEMRHKQIQEPIVQWEIQGIVIRDEHAWWITCVLIAEALIWHIESRGHILLIDPNKPDHYKGINCHDVA